VIATAFRGARRKDKIMRRILVGAAVLLSVTAMASQARAEPPVHDHVIVKDGTATLTPPIGECPVAASSVDVTFHLQLHAVFTGDTFHVTQTLNGEFVSRDASGAMRASGHFVIRTSQQEPGFPVLAVTDVAKTTGQTVDGELINFRIVFHVTVTANDEVSVVFDKITC